MEESQSVPTIATQEERQGEKGNGNGVQHLSLGETRPVSALPLSTTRSGFSWKVNRPPASKWINPLPDSVRMKIVSLGASGSGKSCLIKRYCEERFVSKYISTIGVDYGVKNLTLQGKECNVDFWDLSGNSEFVEIRNEFYQDTSGICLVFDVNLRKTFEQLESLLRESEKFGAIKPVIVVFANKTDVKKRVVSEKEARDWSSNHGFPYFETSASTNSGVKDAFEALFRGVLESMNEKEG